MYGGAATVAVPSHRRRHCSDASRTSAVAPLSCSVWPERHSRCGAASATSAVPSHGPHQRERVVDVWEQLDYKIGNHISLCSRRWSCNDSCTRLQRRSCHWPKHCSGSCSRRDRGRAAERIIWARQNRSNSFSRNSRVIRLSASWDRGPHVVVTNVTASVLLPLMQGRYPAWFAHKRHALGRSPTQSKLR